jgi:hypothetical protein
MKSLEALDIETADQLSMGMGATTAIDYYPSPRNLAIFSVHYFLEDGQEIAMYHPTLQRMQVFEPPREWGDGVKQAQGKPRSLQGLVPVSELIGEALDYAVCKAGGYEGDADDIVAADSCCTPSTDPSQAMDIIEKAHIEWRWFPHEPADKQVGARRATFYGPDRSFCQFGPNILVAAMRCYVASKLGDSVYIPKELLP